MDIYHYHPETHEYLGTSEARLDPLETAKSGRDAYLIPINATTDVPPVAEDNQIAVRNGDAWEIKEDHRGKTVYDKITALPAIVEAIGPIPDTYTALTPCEYPKWGGTQWIEDEAARVAGQSEMLKLEAQTALAKSDMAAIRCIKAGAPYPSEWVAYDEALRAIVRGASTATELPTMPDYPEGT